MDLKIINIKDKESLIAALKGNNFKYILIQEAIEI